LLRKHLGRPLSRPVGAVGAVLRTVLPFRRSGCQRLEVLEDRFGSLEPLAVTVREERDLVLAFPVLLARSDLLRDEVDAELGQPLADGGGVRAPLCLVQRQHFVAMFDAETPA